MKYRIEFVTDDLCISAAVYEDGKLKRGVTSVLLALPSVGHKPLLCFGINKEAEEFAKKEEALLS